MTLKELLGRVETKTGDFDALWTTKIRANLPVHEPDGTHKSLVSSSLRINGPVVECLDLRLAELELMPQQEL